MRGSATGIAASLALCGMLGVAPGARAAGGGAADSLPADSLAAEGLPVSSIVIDARTIFDPVPPGRLAGLYRFANRAHVRTRPATVREHLLLAPGDPWRAARASETERGLRSLDIFDSVGVSGERSGDSVRVRVSTQDAWTSSPEFNLERGGGRLFGSAQFSERNLLGRAQQVELSYREDPSGISRSVSVSDPAVGGSRLVARAAVAKGSSVTSSEASFGLPFYAEDTPASAMVRVLRIRSEARLYQNDVEVSHFPRENEQIEIVAGRGRRSDRTIARLTGSFLLWDRSFGATTLAPDASPAFAGREERLRVRRFSAEGRLWRPDFVERSAVERLDGVEDFDLGRSLTVTAGVSPHLLGATATEGYAAASADLGVDAGVAGFGWTKVRASSRIVDGPDVRDVRFEARWVNQAIPRHTLVLAAFAGAGWNESRDFQFVIGGLDGLRAHGVHALTGQQAWRLNAESRWLIGHEYYQLVSLGAAAFWDAARTWGLGSTGAPWQQDLGVGLRLSLPHSALNRVIRLDLAWRASPRPVTPGQAVFSFGSSQAF